MKAEDEFENAIDSFVRLGANDQCGKVFKGGLYGLPVRLKRKSERRETNIKIVRPEVSRNEGLFI